MHKKGHRSDEEEWREREREREKCATFMEAYNSLSDKKVGTLEQKLTSSWA